MTKYKLGDCSDVFGKKEHLLKLIEGLKNDIHQVFGVVQNSDIIVGTEDLNALAGAYDDTTNNIAKLATEFDKAVDSIWDYIDSHKVKVSDE